LAPALGFDDAARFQAACIRDVAAAARRLRPGACALFLAFRGSLPPWRELAGITIRPQRGADLGARIASAVTRLLAEPGVDRALLIGTDCLELSADVLRRAAKSLDRADAVLLAARDGGFVLIGVHARRGGRLRAELRALLAGLPWSRSHTLDAVRDRLREAGWRVDVRGRYADVDTPDDLRVLEAQLSDPKRRSPAPRHVAALLRSLRA